MLKTNPSVLPFVHKQFRYTIELRLRTIARTIYMVKPKADAVVGEIPAESTIKQNSIVNDMLEVGVTT